MKNKTILAVDFGLKRTGLALKPAEADVVLPYGVVSDSSAQELAKKITDAQAEVIVFGLPLGLDGAENENTARVRNFASQVKSLFPAVLIDFVDERFSTQAAQRLVGGASVDERSAMILLDMFLAKN